VNGSEKGARRKELGDVGKADEKRSEAIVAWTHIKLAAEHHVDLILYTFAVKTRLT
jgi:hypothetical protein